MTDPALLRHASLSSAVRPDPHRKRVARPTHRDQLRVRPTRDTDDVADDLDVRRAGDGAPVCRARVAGTFTQRLRGLMGVARLEPGSGLLLPRTSSVHTHFMRFAIDVVFLDDEGRIARIVPALRPWRFAAAKGAGSVLELAAGECQRLGLAAGDRLS
jgi:uncharacterized membrane protein (UPF0127 family)